jgi:hypothetical protein
MSQLPPAIAIRLKGRNSFNAAMTVIEELCAENAGLRAEKEKLAAENKRLQAQLAQIEAKLRRPSKTSKNSSLPPSQETKPNGGAKGEPATDCKTACKSFQILECAPAGGQFEFVDLTPLVGLQETRSHGQTSFP